MYIMGGCSVGVESDLEMWVVSQVKGHLILCLREGKEWGGASGCSRLPCSVAPPSRALAENWWSVRSELSS